MARNQRTKIVSAERALKLTKKEFQAKIQKFFKNQGQAKSRSDKRCPETGRIPSSGLLTKSAPRLISSAETTSPIDDVAVASPNYNLEAAVATVSVEENEIDAGSSTLLSMPSLDLFWPWSFVYSNVRLRTFFFKLYISFNCTYMIHSCLLFIVPKKKNTWMKFWFYQFYLYWTSDSWPIFFHLIPCFIFLFYAVLFLIANKFPLQSPPMFGLVSVDFELILIENIFLFLYLYVSYC